jgi:uncharacterized protein YbjQ (UPF0145 family)
MIYLAGDAEVDGPFTVEELRRLWDGGEIGPEQLYWHRGMPAWRPIAEYKPPTPEVLQTPASLIKLTTADTIAGREIATELDIITAECVLGVNAFRDLLTQITDLTGGRSKAMQEALRRARTTCLAELRVEAHACRADAVIAIDLDYSELSGQGKSMLFLVASGTAVRLVDVPPPLR